MKVFVIERTSIDRERGYIDFAMKGDKILYRMYFRNRDRFQKIVDYNFYGKPGKCVRGKARTAIINAVNGMIENDLGAAVAILL